MMLNTGARVIVCRPITPANLGVEGHVVAVDGSTVLIRVTKDPIRGDRVGLFLRFAVERVKKRSGFGGWFKEHSL